jgi:Zn-dependent peptidase ImmA (M78 family)
VVLAPRVLAWARERASLSQQELSERLDVPLERVEGWERDGRLTLSRVQKLAGKTHTPFGYLFLSDPPDERLDLPDYRAIRDDRPATASPELLDVLGEAERRQAWYRAYLLAYGAGTLDWVGSISPASPAADAAARIRARIRLSVQDRLDAGSWEKALTQDIDRIEEAGVLVMRTGIVGTNTHRPLSVDEFRGFCIADRVAPLIFLNGRDAKAAQMFTLMHELTHIWVGRSAISNLDQTRPSGDAVERFCNAVAAELLVPESVFRERVQLEGQVNDEMVARLTRGFRVSSLVILRRLFDMNAIDWDNFRRMYSEEEEAQREREARTGSGGNFYDTQQARVGPAFASALIAETMAGRTTYREAFRLLGIQKTETFNSWARRLGMPVE